MNGTGESIEIECLTELNSLIIDKNDQENKLNYFSLYLTFDFIAYLLRRKVKLVRHRIISEYIVGIWHHLECL